MRNDVIASLRSAQRMYEKLRRLQEFWERLDFDDRLILEILLDDEVEKVMRICNELQVSKATAYRYIDQVLEDISNFLVGF